MCSGLKAISMNRLYDILLVLISIWILAIPSIIIAMYIALCHGRPVIFCQTRVGFGGNTFILFKFRTMDSHLEGPALTVDRDPRIQTWGHRLRRFRIDEIPQLFNIIRGEMSFVGPRPEIPEFVNMDNPIQRSVLQVRPGLVDSATLYWADTESILLSCANNSETYYRNVILPDKLAKSMKDIETKSFKGDLRLMLGVFQRLLKSTLKSKSTRSEMSSNLKKIKFMG